MLIKLGNSIVDSEEIVCAKAGGDDLTIEILFKSHGKVFNNGKTVIVDSHTPEADLDRGLKQIAEAAKPLRFGLHL